MTIVICLDINYYPRTKILFDSLKKNWTGRVCVLCIDFAAPDQDHKYYGFEFVSCKLEKLPSYRHGWPANRDFYVCCEGGDFLDYFKFEDSEMILQLDADMIMQRQFDDWDPYIIKLIQNRPGKAAIGMSPAFNPTPTLREEFHRLRPKKSYGKVNIDFPGRWGEMPLYCCGVIVCRADTYKKISQLYLADIDKMIDCFDHHAAGQWLFNYHCKDFDIINLGNTFHNAFWFIDTDVEDGEQLTHKGNVVLFNHTKFIRDYKY